MVFRAGDFDEVGGALAWGQGDPSGGGYELRDGDRGEFPGFLPDGDPDLAAVVLGLLVMAAAGAALRGDVSLGAVGVEAEDIVPVEVFDRALHASGPFAGDQHIGFVDESAMGGVVDEDSDGFTGLGVVESKDGGMGIDEGGVAAVAVALGQRDDSGGGEDGLEVEVSLLEGMGESVGDELEHRFGEDADVGVVGDVPAIETEAFESGVGMAGHDQGAVEMEARDIGFGERLLCEADWGAAGIEADEGGLFACVFEEQDFAEDRVQSSFGGFAFACAVAAQSGGYVFFQGVDARACGAGEEERCGVRGLQGVESEVEQRDQERQSWMQAGAGGAEHGRRVMDWGQSGKGRAQSAKGRAVSAEGCCIARWRDARRE
ncbi:MAG: hypothetical protein RI897_2819 [Verrucomicrobiota bacterium]